MFGTMHVRNKRAFEFSDSVLLSLLNADIAAFEVNFDSVTAYQFTKQIEKAENNFFYKEIFTDEELAKIEGKSKDSIFDFKK
ncbi:MAG: TraB/GumN family protein [Bacteroidales bacterium]|nr:TraB/GumN family protein [Bacteroidales bacterium]